MKNKNVDVIKLRTVLVGICVFLMLGLTAYVLITNHMKEPTDEEIVDNVKEYQKHKSYDEIFTIETPNTWQKVETKYSLNKNAILELYNEKKTSYLVVVVNKKADLTDNFTTYKAKIFKQKESHYKTKISSYHDAIIDSRPAQYGVIYYTNQDNINTYIRSYAFETNNYFGQIVIWTLASNEETISKEFDNITTSLKEIEK